MIYKLFSSGTFTIKRVNGDLRVKKDESYIFKETKGIYEANLPIELLKSYI